LPTIAGCRHADDYQSADGGGVSSSADCSMK
jgi:hypothetical protein